MVKNPEIRKTFMCSTAHITEKDSVMLFRLGAEIIENKEFGYLIPISSFDSNEERFKESKLSASFFNLIKFTKELECDYLMLDCDATVYPELDEFNW